MSLTLSRFSNRGRHLLKSIIDPSSTQLKPSVIWAPSYYCKEALSEMPKSIKIVYYPILANFEPDWNWCRERIKNIKPDFFILCHFFGNLTPSHPFLDELIAAEIPLIDDAAHLSPLRDLKQFCGNYLFFCNYKWLGGTQGAALFSDRSQITPEFELGFNLSDMKEIMRRTLSASRKDLIVRTFSDDVPLDFNSDPGEVRIPEKVMSKFIFNHSLNTRRIQKTIFNREQNRKHWISVLQALPNLEILAAEDPFGLVLRTNSMDNLITKLLPLTRRLASWPSLPADVLSDPKAFSQAHEFRKCLLIVGLDKAPKNWNQNDN